MQHIFQQYIQFITKLFRIYVLYLTLVGQISIHMSCFSGTIFWLVEIVVEEAYAAVDRTCPLEKELNVYYICFYKIYQFPYYLSIPFIYKHYRQTLVGNLRLMQQEPVWRNRGIRKLLCCQPLIGRNYTGKSFCSRNVYDVFVV